MLNVEWSESEEALRFTNNGLLRQADFFSILLDRLADLKDRRLIEIGAWRGFDRNLPIPIEHPTAVGAGVEIFRAFDF